MEKNCLCISSVALVACGAQGAARRGDQTGGCSCLHVPGHGLRALLQGHALAATHEPALSHEECHQDGGCHGGRRGHWEAAAAGHARLPLAADQRSHCDRTPI